MGLSVHTAEFTARDFENFSQKVRDDLMALKQILSNPGFGEGEASVGAELELYIVDKERNALPVNTEITEKLNDPLLTVELNRFNLEYNLSPQPFKGSPFKAMEQELQNAISRINAAAGVLGGEIVPIGILPTLRQSDFNGHTMTDVPRYHALSNALRRMRGGPFSVDIDGKEPLRLQINDVTLEGANTSFQIHWRVPARLFAKYYNAVQLVTPVVLALSANSPSLFGHDLWDETRIALFKQSVDSRAPREQDWRHSPRVYFGKGWLRESAWELFASTVALFPPILPITGAENPFACLAKGQVPGLDELRLHQGTTWPWNRAVYDNADGGHLRIEMRSLPAGPSLIDMSANALFFIGCALAVLPYIDDLTAILPFSYAEHNFYRAAKHGLAARLVWPDIKQLELRDESVTQIAERLLPMAQRALEQTALDSKEIQRLFAVIQGRIEERLNGAQWQRHITRSVLQSTPREEAYSAMLGLYLNQFKTGKPVCEWRTSL